MYASQVFSNYYDLLLPKRVLYCISSILMASNLQVLLCSYAFGVIIIIRLFLLLQACFLTFITCFKGFGLLNALAAHITV